MMVVQTRICVSPVDHALHDRRELLLVHLAVRHVRRPRRRASSRCAGRCARCFQCGCAGSTPARRAAARGAWRRTARSSRAPCTKVCTGMRSCGGSSMVDMSRMPDRAMFSVRGMGVAESVSTSTARLISLMCSLCATPKRCSSSTMSRPRSLNSTSFCSSLVRADHKVALAAAHVRERLA